MDTSKVVKNSRNSTKTDLSLLLECLKSQMKCPDLQKQTLLTIHSICENREDHVDMLREMGGVAFLFNLSKSSIIHPDVKEAALFTLGTLADANVYCKNSLCRKETFAHLADCLLGEDVHLSQKRVSVYLLFVLVTNNRSGQTLAQTTGCLDILLDIFRYTFPLSADATSRAVNATQVHQLWMSVSSALCGCVSNPQNEEGQRICVAAFLTVKSWLQQIDLPRTEIYQPICSFIAMTVSNNSSVQESFGACGGLETLTLALVRLASAAHSSQLSCQLSVIISKTLSACITDNAALASSLAQYDVVSHLFSLLESPHLDPEDRLCVLLSLGHLTEASVRHQSQLLQCGGLPLIITVLTEDTNEEIRKAATFILQTCKQATMCFGERQLAATADGKGELQTDLEGFKNSARELLHKIELLRRKPIEESVDEDRGKNLVVTPGESQTSDASHSPEPPQRKEDNRCSTDKRAQVSDAGKSKHQTLINTVQTDSVIKRLDSGLIPSYEKANVIEKEVCCSMCKGKGFLMSSHMLPLGSDSKPHSGNSHLFKCPLPVSHKKSKEIKCTAELLGSEMVTNIQVEDPSSPNSRCTACVLPFEKVNSRTFQSLQSSCHHSCDIHKVLQDTIGRYRTRPCKVLLRKKHRDGSVKDAAPNAERLWTPGPRRGCEGWSRVSVIPLRRGAREETITSNNMAGPSLTPIKYRHLPGDRFAKTEPEKRRRHEERHTTDNQQKTSTDNSHTRKRRRDFSREEVQYLLSGVQTYGYSWNSILWSYPFQPGRTNVDLAKKYRRLMNSKGDNAGCASSS